MNVFWSIVALLVLIYITYKFGFENGKNSIELSDDVCDIKEKKSLETEVAFLNAFSLYLNIESMIASGQLDKDASESDKMLRASLAYITKQKLFKQEYLRKMKKEE